MVHQRKIIRIRSHHLWTPQTLLITPCMPRVCRGGASTCRHNSMKTAWYAQHTALITDTDRFLKRNQPKVFLYLSYKQLIKRHQCYVSSSVLQLLVESEKQCSDLDAINAKIKVSPRIVFLRVHVLYIVLFCPDYICLALFCDINICKSNC